MSRFRTIFFIASLFFYTNVTASPTALKDTGDCKTYIVFKNSTRVPLNVQVYDEKFDPDSWKGPRPIFEFTLEVSKSGKIKALPNTTYYYLAVSSGVMPTPDMHRNIKGQIESEECKTELEEFE